MRFWGKPAVPCWLYVIGAQNGSFAKVGISHNPDTRCKRLEDKTSIKLYVAMCVRTHHARLLEDTTKQMLKDNQITGEFFKCSPEAAIEATKAAVRLICARYPAWGNVYVDIDAGRRRF